MNLKQRFRIEYFFCDIELIQFLIIVLEFYTRNTFFIDLVVLHDFKRDIQRLIMLKEATEKQEIFFKSNAQFLSYFNTFPVSPEPSSGNNIVLQTDNICNNSNAMFIV